MAQAVLTGVESHPPEAGTEGDRDLPAWPSHSALPEHPLPELQPEGGAPYTGLFLLPVTLSLEVSVGKATDIYAVNGTEILLPCTFSSCFGFEDLHFRWTYNSSDAFRVLIEGTVKNEKSDPRVTLKDDDRITLVGSTKEKMNNISIVLRDLEFSDTGKYTCHVKNPKENNLQHHATIFLQGSEAERKREGGLLKNPDSDVFCVYRGFAAFLDDTEALERETLVMEEVDNTVTLIILAVVGGVIGLLILILLIKKLIIFILKKTREKKILELIVGEELKGCLPALRPEAVKALVILRGLEVWSLTRKECLVSSSGNDNTENGLPGSRAEEKPPSKV
ncbi:Sodium channel subunit beta-4 [Saguinus oedipus]|uniref:Sodium channel subunit beta-4 n=1 Tax=Saguinus oedipus TaxID=9490 RepID=A0ABQ9USR8_SAGOE|nr:Sodium channel subunit beta-4 [Saguinus oedipus]